MNCSLYCTPPFLVMTYCLYFLQVVCHIYPFLSIFVGAFHIPNFTFSIITCHQRCISMLPIMLSMVHGGGYHHVHNKYPNIVWKGLQYSQAWSQMCMEECITMFMIGIMIVCWRRIYHVYDNDANCVWRIAIIPYAIITFPMVGGGGAYHVQNHDPNCVRRGYLPWW